MSANSSLSPLRLFGLKNFVFYRNRIQKLEKVFEIRREIDGKRRIEDTEDIFNPDAISAGRRVNSEAGDMEQ